VIFGTQEFWKSLITNTDLHLENFQSDSINGWDGWVKGEMFCDDTQIKFVAPAFSRSLIMNPFFYYFFIFWLAWTL